MNTDAGDALNPRGIFSHDCARIENPHLFHDAPVDAPKNRDQLTYGYPYFKDSRRLVTIYRLGCDQEDPFVVIGDLSNLGFARFVERVYAELEKKRNEKRKDPAIMLAFYDSDRDRHVSRCACETLYSLFRNQQMNESFNKRGISIGEFIGGARAISDLFRNLGAPLIRPEYPDLHLTNLSGPTLSHVRRQQVWQKLFSQIEEAEPVNHSPYAQRETVFYQEIGQYLLNNSEEFTKDSREREVLAYSTEIIGEIAYAIYTEIFLKRESRQLAFSF